MKEVIPEVCAPSKFKRSYTCYSKKDIHALKRRYNRTHRKKIKQKKTFRIWKDLLNNLNCQKESCISEKLHIKTTRFSPKHPSEWDTNPTAWLSSTDITNALTQYERAYPEFRYIGPSPADFYFRENGTCVWEELCRFNVHTTALKKTKVGIIFNLDTHEGGGTHWVAIFMDLVKKIMYYFDSTGVSMKEEPHIYKFYEKVKKQDPQYKLVENHPVEHQFGNTECGIYVLFFTILMIQTGDFSMFKNKQRIFTDNAMIKLRKKLFN
jgi:hypothetical protein